MNNPQVGIESNIETESNVVRIAHDMTCQRCKYPETALLVDRATMDPFKIVCSRRNPDGSPKCPFSIPHHSLKLTRNINYVCRKLVGTLMTYESGAFSAADEGMSLKEAKEVAFSLINELTLNVSGEDLKLTLESVRTVNGGKTI